MLTQRQSELLEFCRSTSETEGGFPTLEEMAKAMGCRSTNSIRAKLEKIAAEGHIVKKPNGRYRMARPDEAPVVWREVVEAITSQKTGKDIAREIAKARELLKNNPKRKETSP